MCRAPHSPKVRGRFPAVSTVLSITRYLWRWYVVVFGLDAVLEVETQPTKDGRNFQNRYEHQE
jgi:hypothetical protein